MHRGCLCQNPWLSARHCELRSPAHRSQVLRTSSSHRLFDSSNRHTRTQHKRLLRGCHTSAETHLTKGNCHSFISMAELQGNGVGQCSTTTKTQCAPWGRRLKRSCKQEVVPAAGLHQHTSNFLLCPPHLPACNLVTNTKLPDGEVAGGYEGSPASLSSSAFPVHNFSLESCP